VCPRVADQVERLGVRRAHRLPPVSASARIASRTCSGSVGHAATTRRRSRSQTAGTPWWGSGTETPSGADRAAPGAALSPESAVSPVFFAGGRGFDSRRLQSPFTARGERRLPRRSSFGREAGRVMLLLDRGELRLSPPLAWRVLLQGPREQPRIPQPQPCLSPHLSIQRIPLKRFATRTRRPVRTTVATCAAAPALCGVRGGSTRSKRNGEN
jgi:hypothetical protein